MRETCSRDAEGKITEPFAVLTALKRLRNGLRRSSADKFAEDEHKDERWAKSKKKKHEMENRNRETGARASAELGVDGCRMGYGDGV